MTAEMFGALNTAIPTPIVARATQDPPHGTRRVGQLHHAGGHEDHADGGEDAGPHPVGQTAGEGREDRHQHRLHEQQQTGLLRREALDDLEVDRGQGGHREYGHVVEERGGVAGRKHPVLPQQIEIEHGLPHPILHEDEGDQKARPRGRAARWSPALPQPQSGEKVSGMNRAARAAPSRPRARPVDRGPRPAGYARRSRRSARSSDQPARIVAAAMGTLMKKIHRQLAWLTMRPPMTGPRVRPT